MGNIMFSQQCFLVCPVVWRYECKIFYTFGHAEINPCTRRKQCHCIQGVSWKTKVKSVFGKLGKCCFYLQYFLYNINNDKSKQKYTQSHSSYKIETSNF